MLTHHRHLSWWKQGKLVGQRSDWVWRNHRDDDQDQRFYQWSHEMNQSWELVPDDHLNTRIMIYGQTIWISLFLIDDRFIPTTLLRDASCSACALTAMTNTWTLKEVRSSSAAPAAFPLKKHNLWELFYITKMHTFVLSLNCLNWDRPSYRLTPLVTIMTILVAFFLPCCSNCWRAALNP